MDSDGGEFQRPKILQSEVYWRRSIGLFLARLSSGRCIKLQDGKCQTIYALALSA